MRFLQRDDVFLEQKQQFQSGRGVHLFERHRLELAHSLDHAVAKNRRGLLVGMIF